MAVPAELGDHFLGLGAGYIEGNGGVQDDPEVGIDPVGGRMAPRSPISSCTVKTACRS